MGSGIDTLYKKLVNKGLVFKEDFLIIDASDHKVNSRIKDHQEVFFEVDWIRGVTHGSGTMISCSGGDKS